MDSLLTSPLLSYANYMLLGLLIYAGAVGLLLTLLDESGPAYNFVRRVFLPSALNIMAFLCALAVLSGGAVGFIIAKSLI